VSNVFRFSSVSYFQVPESLIQTGTWALLKESAKDLYLLLLHEAQRTSSIIVRLKAADAAKVGLVPNSVKAGRDDLIANGLIAATKGNGGFLYELLNPATQQSLAYIEDLTKVDPEVVGDYFAEALAAYDPQELHQSLQAHCPFHDSLKGRQHPLHVTFTNGGAFTCHDCNTAGGIVDFEIALAARNGESLDRNRGYGRVREALLSVARKRERRRVEDLALARSIL
jgi:hypothetical protein